MTTGIARVLAVLGVTILLFVTEALRVDVSAITIMAALLLPALLRISRMTRIAAARLLMPIGVPPILWE